MNRVNGLRTMVQRGILQQGWMLLFALVLTACGSGIEPGDPTGRPSFTTQPQSITVGEGGNTTFSVVATGAEPMAYQWYLNGSPITGATTASYTTPALGLSSHGAVYTVVATNSLGSTTSQAATVTVTPGLPAFTTQPVAVDALDEGTATFSARVAGAGPFTYQWFRIPAGGTTGSAITGATADTYTTPTLTMGDSGERFYVVVTGAGGAATSSLAALTVSPRAPTVTSQPGNVSVTGDGSFSATATFAVTATGTAPLTYQWYRNGTVIPGATSATLTATATHYGFDGSHYSVAVINAGGATYSQGATLRVSPTGASTTILTSCGTIATAGSYRLGGALATSTDNATCIEVTANDVHLDCNGQSITANGPAGSTIDVTAAQRFSVRGCSLRAARMNVTGASDGSINDNDFAPTAGGTLATVIVADSSRVGFHANRLPAGQYMQRFGNGNAITGNTLTSLAGETVAARITGVVESSFSTGTRIVDNTVDGNWDTGTRGNVQQNGAKSAVVLFDESDATVRGNALRRVFTCGVELFGTTTNLLVASNALTDLGQCAVGGNYYMSLSGSSIVGNTADRLPRMFEFYRSGGLRPARTEQGHAVAADTVIAFRNNLFASNTLLNPQPADRSTTAIGPSIIMQLYTQLDWRTADPVMPGERTPPVASDFQITSNTFTANNFGKAAEPPVFGGPPFTAGIVVDGGRNVCMASTTVGYPIQCR